MLPSVIGQFAVMFCTFLSVEETQRFIID